MEGLLQPTNLFFILLIVLILFGPGKLPRLGEGWRRTREDFRRLPRYGAYAHVKFRRDPFETSSSKSSRKGIMSPNVARWIKFLIAILLGNALYFYLLPNLPPAARHKPFKVDFGTLVDLWLCLFMYGLIELGGFLQGRLRKRDKEK